MQWNRPWERAADEGDLAVMLVRHGQTEWNAAGRFLGRTDIGLDSVGRDQARELSIGIGDRVDHVYSSPLSRARETAEAFHPSPICLDALRELDQGGLEGMKVEAAIQQFPEFFQGWAKDPGSVKTPGGEGLLECQARMRSVLDHFAATHDRGTVVAAFSHQLAIASTVCSVVGSPLRRWQDHRLPNCGISVLRFNGQSWSIGEHGWVVGNLRITTGSALPDV